MLAIVVPWYAALYQRYGWTYITSFIRGREHRAVYRGFRRRERVEGCRSTCRWCSATRSRGRSAFSVRPALWVAEWRARRAAARLAARPDPRLAFRVRTLLWLWISVIVGFFTFSAAKQDLYIFPIVPAVAALAGLFIARETSRWRRGAAAIASITAALIGLLLAVAGAGTFYIFQTSGKVYALRRRRVRRQSRPRWAGRSRRCWR